MRGQSNRRALIFDLLLVILLLAGAYFRMVGINWGEYQYLHPDERFLVWVGTDIQPVELAEERLGAPPSVATVPWRAAYPEQFPDCDEWGGYFDSSCSSLNPNNRGHGFYVYGTLPLFMARYVVEWVFGHSGFNEMTDIGRPLSAMVDLLTVLLVYLIATRLHDRRVGLLAAAFSAFTVMQIQLAHYFTVDTFLNFFTYLAIYFAVRVSGAAWQRSKHDEELNESFTGIDPGMGDEIEPDDAEMDEEATSEAWLLRTVQFMQRSELLLSVAFGIALGCAAASKLNAVPVAIMLPIAFGFAVLRSEPSERGERLKQAVLYVAIAAVVSIITFRIFQPYAFSGPGFFGLKPNPQWVSNIREQRVQAAGDVDFPPAMQWARRPVWFSIQNLVTWGLGLPLGLLAWSGFLWAGWRMLSTKDNNRSAWQRHGLLWFWTGAYFIWQSLQFNPTMRYQLPIYPSLAIFASWAVVALIDWRRDKKDPAESQSTERKDVWASLIRAGGYILGGAALTGTLAWAYAFTQIYERPITRVEASRWIYQNVPGPINVHIETESGVQNQLIPFPNSFSISPEQPYVTSFNPRVEGTIEAIYLNKISHAGEVPQSGVLTLTLGLPGSESILATASLPIDEQISTSNPGAGSALKLDQQVLVHTGETYQIVITMQPGSGAIRLLGAAPANESSWDDGLPVRVDGYDGYGSIYQPGLNFELYWDDNPEKLERMLEILDQADYLFISSSRQWGSLPRLTERFPLVANYYHNLLGCPPEQSVEWCYSVAQPGSFEGNLGFDLIKTFQSDPIIGPLRINDQFSEEAFTVYDHPKVFIFRKSDTYNSQQARNLLETVDLTQVVHVTPKRAAAHPANLMLPADRWAEQRAGGTWSELFSTEALYNRYPGLGAVIWYVSIALLGIIFYPIVRVVLPGLSDRGYPLARIIGMLTLSYIVWVAGSAGIPFSRLTISLVVVLLVAVGSLAAIQHKDSLKLEFRQRGRYYLMVEGLFLAFFVFDLLIRIGNPDLWHPWKGGERPMDFAYFNAILKSTTFPPYDPWYAGGYLNYYYFGFVFVGVLVKLLGIVPAVAYNLILPTVFAMIAMGAFSLGWNLIAPKIKRVEGTVEKREYHVPPFWVGLAAALGMAVLGNLGSFRMIFQGYQRLAAPGGIIEGAGVLTRWGWALQGAMRVLAGEGLPYSLGDWYWLPSRAIPAPGDVEPITEFPFFTVLYGDPHAHLFALAIAILVLAFALSVVLGRGRWAGKLETGGSFLLGGLAIGALRPTNTWDIYTYLAIGCVALAFTYASYDRLGGWAARALKNLSIPARRLIQVLASVAGLFTLSQLLFRPYTAWYGLGYSKIAIWTGTHTPLSAYFTHWGLFLFVIVSWMVWETRDWLASTPVSALRKLQPYRGMIQFGLVLLILAIVLLLYLEASIAWLVLPLAAWAGVLLLRPGISDTKRFVLFLVGTGLVLTLMVEVVVLVGDVGRMNTVFKFYLQVWTIFAVSAAASLGWLIGALPKWDIRWRISWQIVLVALVSGASLFTLLGSAAKVKDRMTDTAPHTLDGMAFMAYATYADTWGEMDLSQDYRAIRWMQENVTGSPVIVEANLVNLYRWGSRFSIYTGLPGVVGWEWHQQQQRAVLPGNWVSDRIAEIAEFYTTTDTQQAVNFLNKYDVRHIILGQQERGLYAGEGLVKFAAEEGRYWQVVYQDLDTIIYQVIKR